MNVFQKVDQYDKEKYAISLQTHALTPEIQRYLQQELHDKSFVQAELQRLLKADKYISVVCQTITIHYIPQKEITQAFMKRFIKRLVVLARVFQLHVPVQYWILPCRTKRFFPKKGEVAAEHINGGYTYTHNHTIFIYRLEEFPKVAIHELLHNSLLHVHSWEKASLLEMYQAFHIDTHRCDTYCSTQLTPNEAIIEAWALMMHLYFVSKEEKVAFSELYHKELAYNLSMSHKLLVYQQETLPLWKEKTHSYSYIRLKTCILYYWKVFSKIPYPYDAQRLTRFFLEYNLRKPFLEKILKSPLPKDHGFRMTRSGDR